MPTVADQVNDALARSREEAAEHEDELARAYAQALTRLLNDIVKRFRERATPLLAAADWIPPQVDDVVNMAVQSSRMRAAQRQMMEAISGTLSTVPGIGFDVMHPVIQGLLDQIGSRSEALGEGLRQPVADAIARGWAEGASVPQTAAAIRKSVGSQIGYRATALARTDLIGLSNGGGHYGVQQLNDSAQEAGQEPPIKSRTWANAGDSRVRPTHEEAEGQTVPIDQPFTVGGAQLQYPGDPFGPSDEVIQCRCVEIYNQAAAVPAPTPPVEEGLPGRSDLANQLLGKAEDTRARFTLPGGAYTPERLALHRQIATEFLKEGATQAQPRATFMAGGSGAGKSTVMKAVKERGGLPDRAVHIDPDAIKERLPEYQQLLDAGDQAAARLVHEESGDIAKAILDEAQARKFNMVVDGTGDSDPGKFLGKLTKQHEAGYEVDVIVVDIPTDEAVARAVARAQRSGRFVPEDVIRGIHRDVSARFDEWQDSAAVRRWSVWANEERPPKMIASRGPDGTEIISEERFRQFLRKADESVEKPQVKVTDAYNNEPHLLDRAAIEEVNEAMRQLDGNLGVSRQQKLEHLRNERVPVKAKAVLSDSEGRPTAVEGMFIADRLGTSTSYAREIQVATTTFRPGTTLLHELGHFLDSLVEDVQIYASHNLNTSARKGLLAALEETEAVRALRSYRARLQLKIIAPDTEDRIVTAAEEARKHIDYLLSPQELFARAFTQFMVERYGGRALKGELGQTLRMNREPNRLPSQWEGGDFTKVARAMEAFLRDEGLLGPLDASEFVVNPRLFPGHEVTEPTARLFAGQPVRRKRVDDLLVRPALLHAARYIEGDHPREDSDA